VGGPSGATGPGRGGHPANIERSVVEMTTHGPMFN
jgi:hypothetical protein